MSLNIAALLSEQASSQPRHPAVVFVRGRCQDGGRDHACYAHLTFGELDRRSDALAWGLQEYGLRPGMKALLMIRPALDFYALVFALLKMGVVPVLIDPGMGWDGFLRCVRQCAPEAFFGIPAAHLLRLVHPRVFKSVRFNVTLGGWRPWGGRTIPRLLKNGHAGERFPLHEAADADELAAVMFTSGSTGPAKGVCYTQRVFAAQCAIVKRLCRIRPGEYDLACFPLFSLFSVACGATAVVPEMDATRPASVDPSRIAEAIRDWPITYSFGSPALWKHVSEAFVRDGTRLEGLGRIFMSGAPVPASTHSNLAALMGEGGMSYAPYGCTEALPIAVLDGHSVINETDAVTRNGGGVCVGEVIPEVTARIIRITDEPIPEWDDALVLPAGSIGELCVTGECVTRSYFNRPDADELSKIDGADGRRWHRVGDVGYLDKQNRFWFCGRKSHRVESESGPLYTIPVEAFYNQLPGVARSALVGVGERGHQIPFIIVQLMPGCRLTPPEILAGCAGRTATAAIRNALVYPGDFPVDVRHNAKINREKLALWAAEQIV